MAVAGLAARRGPRRRPPRVDDEVILETIFAKPTGWLLPHPVPLAHMVELLEDEGPTGRRWSCRLAPRESKTRDATSPPDVK